MENQSNIGFLASMLKEKTILCEKLSTELEGYKSKENSQFQEVAELRQKVSQLEEELNKKNAVIQRIQDCLVQDFEVADIVNNIHSKEPETYVKEEDIKGGYISNVVKSEYVLRNYFIHKTKVKDICATLGISKWSVYDRIRREANKANNDLSRFNFNESEKAMILKGLSEYKRSSETDKSDYSEEGKRKYTKTVITMHPEKGTELYNVLNDSKLSKTDKAYKMWQMGYSYTEIKNYTAVNSNIIASKIKQEVKEQYIFDPAVVNELLGVVKSDSTLSINDVAELYDMPLAYATHYYNMAKLRGN